MRGVAPLRGPKRKECFMKLVLRAATALAILGLATPAFPCGEKKMTTASSTTASKDKEKEAVAKTEKKAQAKAAKTTPQKASATN
jgi:hypothetical protein